MPNVSVIYQQGNGFTKKMKNYRKTMINQIPTLRYLEDRPVFDDDRVFAEAYCRGGIQEEKRERERLRKEKEEAHWKNHMAFKEMIAKAREEKRLADEAKKAASGQLAIEAESAPKSESPKKDEDAQAEE